MSEATQPLPAPDVGVSALAAAVIEPDGTVREWTSGAERLVGHPAGAVVGRRLDALLAPGTPADVRARLLHGPAGGVRAVLRHGDGRPIGTEIAVAPLNGPGAPCTLLVFGLLPHERGLDRSLKDWALEQLPVVAAITDRELRYVHVNERGCVTWNRPAEEILGRTMLDVRPDAAGRAVYDDMRLAVESGEPRTLRQYSRLPHDTRDRAWNVYNTPLKDGTGRVRGLFMVAVETTGEYWARERLALLNRASATIGSTLDVTRTADELAQVLVPTLADIVTVDLLEPPSGDQALSAPRPEEPVVLRRAAARSVLPGLRDVVVMPGATDVYSPASTHARALAGGRAYISPFLDDPAFDEWVAGNPRRAEKAREYGFHSVMVVPLRARGTTLGVACFYRHRHPDPFDEDDLLLAEEISGRAAVCLDNALRYTRERATALTLQHSLLPRALPHLAGVDVAGRYLPSDVRGGVGGDWYDVIRLSGGRVALVVGDVVGHGIHASATMGRLRASVRTLADMELQPDELLTRLDDLISHPADPGDDGESGVETQATCLYAVYSPVSRMCCMARAGHPPPALVRPGDGRVELLDVPAGPPLGLGGMPFERLEIRLEEGSVLALYTDGLVESRGNDVGHGLDELCDRLSRPAESLDETCDAVLEALPPGPPPDDVALLLARTRMLDPAHVVDWEFPADPMIVGTARARAARQLSVWGLDEVAFSTELMVSELVTNALRHASGPIGLRLILEDGLICEVADHSSTFPRLRAAHSFDEDGRGLMLVAQISRRWGTRPTDTGKIIWADQALPGGSAA